MKRAAVGAADFARQLDRSNVNSKIWFDLERTAFAVGGKIPSDSAASRLPFINEAATTREVRS